jgi:amyloid beta precursor protein binding protein 1
MFEDLVKAHGLELGAADDEASLNAPLVTKISTELCRLNHAENHNVASIVGGVGSQEAVKIVTQQMVPICNTYTFNGIAGTAAVFRG